MPYQAPADPIKAVTHPDPYPYYAGLATAAPLYFDGGLGMWVASGSREVTAVLEDEACLVRSPGEPVPGPIVGTAAGDVFGRLVRMVDGEFHDRMKGAVVRTVHSRDSAAMALTAITWARHLISRAGVDEEGGIRQFALDLPVYTLGDLLGADPRDLGQIAALAGSFVRGIAPAASADQAAAGGRAAEELQKRFASVLETAGHTAPDALIRRLAREAGDRPEDVEAVVPNAIGFLSQALEATAALILNTLLALAKDQTLRVAVSDDAALIPLLVEEVLRVDPPVHNTRRYVSRKVTIAGQLMEKGDAILVILAAANYDPAVNPSPGIIDLLRAERRQFTFGIGRHACAGTELAIAVAAAGVQELLAAGLELSLLDRPLRYVASGNIRMPMLDTR